MFYALSWLVVVALLALWSLAAWGLHAVAVWTVSNASAMPGVGDIALPGWLAPWVPAELVQAVTQLVAAFGPLVDRLLQAAPALTGGLTAVSWAVWGLGAVLLLLLGAGGHLLIALWRRAGRGGAGPSLAAR